MKTKIFLIGMLFAGMTVLNSCESTDPQEMGGKSIPELCDQIINMPLADAQKVLEKEGFVYIYETEYSNGVNYHFEREAQTMDVDVRKGIVSVAAGYQIYSVEDYKDAFTRYRNWSEHGWKKWSSIRDSWEAYLEPDPETIQFYYEGDNEYMQQEYPLRRKDFMSDWSRYEVIEATHETIYGYDTESDKGINQVNIYFFTSHDMPSSVRRSSAIGGDCYMIAYGVMTNLGAMVVDP